MDYKKKYDEILVKLQDLLNNAKRRGHIVVRTEDIENIFPELNESEDERIKRELRNDLILYVPSPERYIAWLEK